ncbi:MAG: site-specific integrase [Thermomicrobiales bacterium]|nr:site-specific integrase [Thermomicrobiales bacterium]
MSRSTGIEIRHARSCRGDKGGRCNCSPSYRAQVYLKRDGKAVRKTFRSREEAVAWRQDALVAARRGAMRPSVPRSLRQVAEDWLVGARDGTITNRSGDPYKPAAVRGYEKAMRLRIYPELSDARFSDVRVIDLQELVDRWRADGLSASTIDSTLNPLRAIYRRVVNRGEVAINPTKGLELPAIRSKPRRFATPAEAEALIAALPKQDRPIWATAFYAGLRRGELRALRVENVDLAAGVIRVEHGWDDVEGEIPPKNAQGRHKVPIPAILRDHLDAVKLPTEPADLIFGTGGRNPFQADRLGERARKAYDAAELERVTLHEARHTFASLMIAAGVNAKALSTFMGHHSINITLDLYGHLMPGSEAEAAGPLDQYLEAVTAQAADVGWTSDGASGPDLSASSGLGIAG